MGEQEANSGAGGGVLLSVVGLGAVSVHGCISNNPAAPALRCCWWCASVGCCGAARRVSRRTGRASNTHAGISTFFRPCVSPTQHSQAWAQPPSGLGIAIIVVLVPPRSLELHFLYCALVGDDRREL